MPICAPSNILRLHWAAGRSEPRGTGPWDQRLQCNWRVSARGDANRVWLFVDVVSLSGDIASEYAQKISTTR